MYIPKYFTFVFQGHKLLGEAQWRTQERGDVLIKSALNSVENYVMMMMTMMMMMMCCDLTLRVLKSTKVPLHRYLSIKVAPHF